MKPSHLLFGLAALMALPALFAARAKPGRAAAAEPAPAAVGGPTFDAFRLIGDRNIFSSFRSGRSEANREQTARVDAVALVGTMASEKGTFAFFDGSDPAYRKVVRPGDTVGPFKVTRVQGDAVQVEREGKTLSLRVAQQLQRADEGDWQVTGAEMARFDSAPASAGGDGRPAPAIPADASETLRRLMEQRQKQLKQ